MKNEETAAERRRPGSRARVLRFFLAALITAGVAVVPTMAVAASSGASQSTDGEVAASSKVGSGKADASKAADSSAADTSDGVVDSSGCTACHTKAAASAEDPACLVSKHSDLDCIVCHDSTDEAFQKVHDKASDPSKADKVKQLKKTEVSSDICLACHDRAALVEATEDLSLLTDIKGTTVNPHDLPQVSNHEDIACDDCHKMHSDEDAETTAPNVCLSCHHTGAYECGTCHE